MISPDETSGRIPSDKFKDEFAKIFLSMMDASTGLHQAKIEMTRALLSQGVQVNMQDMFSMTDLVLDRLQRVAIAKSVAPMLGLVGELDDILKREMDIIYAGRPAPTKPHGVVNGDTEGKYT